MADRVEEIDVAALVAEAQAGDDIDVAALVSEARAQDSHETEAAAALSNRYETPERAVSAIRSSRQLGVPLSETVQDPVGWANAAFPSRSMQDLRSRLEWLPGLLSRRPELGAVVADEAQPEGALEKAWRAVKAPFLEDPQGIEGSASELGASWLRGVAQIRGAGVGHRLALAEIRGGDATQELAEWRQAKEEMASPRYRSPLMRAAAGALQMAPGSLASIGATVAGTVAGTRLGGAAGGKLGGRLAGTAVSAYQEAGLAYQEIRELTTEAGEHPSPKVAYATALAYGAVAGFIETSSFGVEGAVSGAIGKRLAVREFSTGLLQAAGKSGALGSAARRLTNAAGEVARSSFGEASEEALQELAKSASEWIGLSTQAGKAQPTDVPGALVQSVEAGAQALLPAGLMGGTLHGTMMAVDAAAERNRSARATGDTVSRLAGTQLAKAAPEEVAALVQRQTGATAQHVDADAWVRQYGEQAHAAAGRVLGENGPAALDAAIATGQRLEVPLAKWLELNQDARAALEPHAAVDPSIETPAEVASPEVQAAKRADVDAIMGEYRAALPPDEGPSPAEQEGRRFAELLVNTGVAPRDARGGGELVRAYVESLASRITPENSEQRSAQERVVSALSLDVRRVAGEDTGPRGTTIVADNEAGERASRILLSPTADATTVAHELGHVFLTTLESVAVAHEDESPIRLLLSDALRELGAQSVQDATTEQHERFARSFEDWLATGNAPTAGLRKVFARLRAWMLALYRGVRQAGADVSPALRDVFGRLLATDDAIARARRGLGLEPAFRSREQAGMSEGAWKRYVESREAAEERVRQRLAAAVADDRARASTTVAREIERGLKADAPAHYQALQAAQARADMLARPLDLAAVRAELGMDELPPGVAVVEGGQNPALVAVQHGYGSVRDMLSDVGRLPDEATWTKQWLADEMAVRFPSLLEDAERMREIAAESLESAEEQDWRLLELEALRKRAGDLPRVSLASIKQAAAETLYGMRLEELSPARHERTARQLQRKLSRAVDANDSAAAYRAAVQLRLNQEMARQSVEALKLASQLDSVAKKLNTSAATERLVRIGDPAQGTVWHMLNVLGLRRPGETDERHPFEPAGLKLWLDGALGTPTTEPADLSRVYTAQASAVQAGARPTTKRLTVGDAQTTLDALVEIQHAVTTWDKLRVAGGLRDFETQVAESVSILLEDAPDRAPVPITGGLVEDLRRHGTDIIAALIQTPAFLYDQLVGLERAPGRKGRAKHQASALQKLLVDDIGDATNRKSQLTSRVGGAVMDAFRAIPDDVKERWREPIDSRALFPDHVTTHEAPQTRGDLFGIALNSGSLDNIQRLEDGRKISPAQRQAALEMLSREEMDAAQSVRDALGSLWPEYSEVHRLTTGVELGRVEASPIVTGAGSWPGGYFPLIADKETRVGDRQDAQSPNDVLDPQRVTRPSTNRSASKARAARAVYVVSLDVGRLPQAIDRAVTDIAYRIPLREAARLLLHPAVAQAAQQRVGVPKYQAIISQLVTIGHGYAEDLPDVDTASRTLRLLRANETASTLGASVRLVLGDLATIPSGSVETRQHLLSSFRELARDPLGFVSATRARSALLTARADQTRQHLAIELARLQKSRLNLFRLRAMEFAGRMSEAVDALACALHWRAGELQALSEGQSLERATRHADRIVKKLMPAKDIADKARILTSRSTLAFIFGRYFGFFSTQGSLWSRYVQAGAYASAFALVMLALVGPELAQGSGPDDDDGPAGSKRRWLTWWLRTTIGGHLALVPGLKPLGDLASTKLLGRNAPNSGRPMPGGAWASQLEQLVRLRSGQDGAAKTGATLAAKAAARVYGLPLPERAIDTWLQADAGKLRISGPLDLAEGAIFGPRAVRESTTTPVDAFRVGQ